MSKTKAYEPRIGGRYERDSADAKPVRTGGTEPAGETEAKAKPRKTPDTTKDGKDGK